MCGMKWVDNIMRNKKTMGLLVALLAVVAVFIVVYVNKAHLDVTASEPSPAEPIKAVTQEPAVGQKVPSKRALPHQQQAGDRTPRQRTGQTETTAGAVAQAPQTSQTEEITEARLKAIEAWEGFIDSVAERTGKPTAEQALAFKAEFAKLDKADQMDGIQTALNLLPEEQFPILYPILFDKTMDPDILDEIFSDGLNHDEDIKVPMMKEIYKDKEHPMYVEAARILDATGELDEEESGVAENE
mgnify:CR=1 FL=1